MPRWVWVRERDEGMCGVRGVGREGKVAVVSRGRYMSGRRGEGRDAGSVGT